MCKSTVPVRQQAAAAIVSSARKHHADAAAAAGAGDAGGRQSRLFQQFASLSDQLIRLCHHNTSDHREKGCAHPLCLTAALSVFCPFSAILIGYAVLCRHMPASTARRGAVILSGDSAARSIPWLLNKFLRTAQEELLNAPRV